jgi:multidrug efflux pump subunit AcrB
MTLSDLSIRRPVFAWMLMSALMFFGVICFLQLGVSQLPEATQPVLTISAEWTGAAPEVMETEIVNLGPGRSGHRVEHATGHREREAHLFRR